MTRAVYPLSAYIHSKTFCCKTMSTSGGSGTSLSPSTTRHTIMNNLHQCEMTGSGGCSASNQETPTQCSCFFSKTQQVKVEEPSCSCKPMLSVMKDKDKRHFFLLPGGEVELASGILSLRQTRRTNGWSCANNCPTTRLKYLCSSISFFFPFFSLSRRSCHYSLHKNAHFAQSEQGRKRKKVMKRSHKYPASIPLLLLILSEIIQVSVGVPIAPTQKLSFEEQPRFNDAENGRGYADYQRKSHNNHSRSFFRNNENSDGSRNSRGDWDHDMYNSGSDTSSNSQLKFTFSSEQQELSQNSNNKFETEEESGASHLQQNHEAVMMMPIPFIESQGLSQQDQQQAPETLAHVTNDSFFGGENISNNNGDGYLGERSSSFLSKNNNNNNNVDDDDGGDRRRNGSISKTGRCWSVVLYEGKGGLPPLFFDDEPLKKPISILCNGTSQLATTLNLIPENLVSQVISIDVKDSSISRLNLTLFHRFPRLTSLSVTHSNVTHVIGSCPPELKALNISFNILRKVDSSVFLVSETKGDNNYEQTDAHHDGDNGETNFSLKSVSSFTSAASSSPTTASSKSDSPAKLSMPSRFNAAHYPENSAAPITSSNQMRASRSFETRAEVESIHKRLSKTSGEQLELIEAAENTNESNDNDGLTPQDRFYSENGRALKNQEETMTFTSIRTTHLAPNDEPQNNYATNLNSDSSSSSDSEKSESYSYEEEGNEGGDYYQRGSLASIATTTSITTKNGRKNENEEDDIEEGPSTSVDGASQIGNLKKSALQDIDLSHNMISEIPSVILDLQGLKSLRLSGNQLKCDFVWEKLADWYMKSEDPNILKDGDETSCGVVDDVRVFHYTVLGVLKAKKDVVETCRSVDKTICHDCSLYSLNKHAGNGYNLSHQSAHGNVAIALKLDCSFQNLTEMPEVPPQTWQLNVSGNFIKDLSSLKEPMYENLLILDADSNEITTLDGLAGTSFHDRYNYLSLQNNRFPVIPSNVLSTLKNMRGQGVTFLGANFLECDCDVVKEIKPLLLENTKKIKDLKEIYCKDMKSQSGESYVAVKDLQYTDLCYMDTEESNEMYLYILITVEIILILVIVAKVWHDQRTFRRTGILPWCSAKMPRLPCDAILESVKEPPHFNRSSSTNVRSFACEPPSQSLSSHVQLREVRSNSGQSEKSSQISQLSSFPSSSRTSSV